MKKIIGLFVILLGCVSFVSAANIVNYTKQGGGLFGYKNVSSSNLGTDADGNRHWQVDCDGGGLNKCKRTLGAAQTQGDEVLDKVDFKIMEMQGEVDILIENGENSGGSDALVQVHLESGEVVLVSILCDWTYDPGSDTTQLTFVVDKVNT